MEQRTKSNMPPEYEFLAAPLFRAQEHVFLINAEIEKLQNNPINEQKIVKLDDEKNIIIQGLKHEFESQTWEDGPSRAREIEAIIDKHMSDQAYQDSKLELGRSNKSYETSRYWEDRYDRNISALQEQYGVFDNPSQLDGHFDFNGYDYYDDLDKD